VTPPYPERESDSADLAAAPPVEPIASVLPLVKPLAPASAIGSSMGQAHGTWPARAESYTLIAPISPSALGSKSPSAGVWLASCCGGREAAVRIVDLETQTSRDFGRIACEVQRMASLRHANLCELHAAFVKRGELWLVMQLHEAGSCADILRLAAPCGLEETAAAAVLREVCQALSYLHSIGLIHRQLKAAAVLVDAHANVRLSDLSLAGALLEFGERRRARQTYVGAGQVFWSAPEMLEQASGYDAGVDIWALGITAIELITGAPPYMGEPPMKVMLKVLQGEPMPVPDASVHFRALVGACLVRAPTERAPAEKLLELPALAALPANACQTVLLPIVRSLPQLRERRAPPTAVVPRTGMLGMPVRTTSGSRGASACGLRPGSRLAGERWWEEGGGWDFEEEAEEPPAAAPTDAEPVAAGGAKLPAVPGANGGASGSAHGGANGGVRPLLRMEGLCSPNSQNASPPTSPIDSPTGSSTGQRLSVEGTSAGDAAPQRRGTQTSVARKRGFVVRGHDSARVAGARLQSLQQAVVGLLRHAEAQGGAWDVGTRTAEAGGWLDPNANVLAVLPRAVEALAQQNEQLREHNRLLREMKGMLVWPPSRATPCRAGSLMGSRAGSTTDLIERSNEDGGLSGNTTATSSLAEHSSEVGKPWFASSRVPSRPASRPVSPRATLQAPPSAWGRPPDGAQLQSPRLEP